MTPTQADLADPALVAAVEIARAAAEEEAGTDEVGAHVDVRVEDPASATHLFAAAKPGYAGWRWAVTVSSAGPGAEVTVSEAVLQPGPDALVAPDWVPWQERIQAGDLGVGDLMPTAPDDDRLVPAYEQSDDPAVEETAMELGLGRQRVLARGAPAHCGTCGFYLPLAGSLRAAFGTCGNEISPADGHVVHAEYGCGAHSEVEVEQVSPVLVADLIYDDAQLDVAPLEPAVTDPVVEPESAEVDSDEPVAAAESAVETPVEDDVVPVAPVAATESVVAVPVEDDGFAPDEPASIAGDAEATAPVEGGEPEAASYPTDVPAVEPTSVDHGDEPAEPVGYSEAAEPGEFWLFTPTSAEPVADAAVPAPADDEDAVLPPSAADTGDLATAGSATVDEPAPESAAVVPSAGYAVDESLAVDTGEQVSTAESAVPPEEEVAPAAAEPVADTEDQVSVAESTEPVADSVFAPVESDAPEAAPDVAPGEQPESSAPAADVPTSDSDVDSPARWAAARPWGYVRNGEDRTDSPGE